MTKEEIIAGFDSSQPGLAEATIFGLPFTAAQSEIIVVPVPWEVTVSYGAGASKGPEAVLESSYQVDLLHQQFPDLWKLGIFYDKAPEQWQTQSEFYKKKAAPIIEALENGENLDNHQQLKADLDEINTLCRNLHTEIKEKCKKWLALGKKVILLGGDHSTPLGYYEALAELHEDFGILHLDAHMDLRIAYEGFTYSHASIMYNALQLPQISKLVQVGIRDFCEEELSVVKAKNGLIKVHTDCDIKTQFFEGKTWQHLCDDYISQLPQKVVVSVDIDGLNALYCPNTGTPVPGGMSYEHATYLLTKLSESGKEIIGMDLVEVAPGNNHWDGNVGARMLFHMCGVLAKSNGLATGIPVKF